MNPIAAVKSVGLHALLLALAFAPCIRGLGAHETTTQCAAPWLPFLGTSGNATAVTVRGGMSGVGTVDVKSTRGGGVYLIGGHGPVKLLAKSPKWGVDIRTARGQSVIRLEPDGEIYVRDEVVEHDVRVLRAFASFAASARMPAPGDGHYLILSPGFGWPRDRMELDGETVFEDADRKTMLRIDQGGWGTFDFGQTTIGAFRLWLDVAVPDAHLVGHLNFGAGVGAGGGSASGGGYNMISAGTGGAALGGVGGTAELLGGNGGAN